MLALKYRISGTRASARLRFFSGGLLPHTDAFGFVARSAFWTFLERIQPRTAAHFLTETLAEMAEAGITHFQRRFRHVAFATLQQFGRTFHPKPAEILRYGRSRFRRESAAEMKRTATGFPPDLLQTERLDEMLPQKRHDPLYPFACQPLLAVTE